MLKTYQGSCHCGAVRFSVRADISAGTEKCNCTICTRMRLWSVKISPAAFRLDTGEDALRDYTYGGHVAHHFFCATCGIHAFDRVDLAAPRAPYYNIAVMCLDGLDLAELLAAPVDFQDGLHDDWGSVPDEVRHL